MPKNYKLGELKLMLERLAHKTGESLDHYGMNRISDKMNGSVSAKYLYDNLLRPVTKSTNRNDKIKLSPNKIDEIAIFLGYQNFNHFLSAQNHPLNPVLMGLPGNYYSYVRKNSKEGALLRSPVTICRSGEELLWQLTGPTHTFIGKVVYENFCLHCLMRSDETGKSFYHVYKIGMAISPEVLMGIFVGTSSANDPIGGRCLMVKQDIDQKLVNEKLCVNDLLNSSSNRDRKIAEYLFDYESNNLKINNPYGFDLDDLEST